MQELKGQGTLSDEEAAEQIAWANNEPSRRRKEREEEKKRLELLRKLND